jgi:hypothetical protein
MKIEQLSIFVENAPGRLAAPVRALAAAGVDLRALFLADTSEFGVLRLIVADCTSVAARLEDEGFVARVTEVVAVAVSDHTGGLAGVLAALDGDGVNIDYMYAFPCRDAERAVLIFSFADAEAAIARLDAAGIKPLASDELMKI